MRYLLLIHSDEAAWDRVDPQGREAMYAEYGKLATEMEERGHSRGGDELAGAATAKIVRVTDGEVSVVDGPFAETREQLGGYFLVECDLDTALGYAARIPSAVHGAVEVREVVDGP
ncbi:MAG: YciI family protein [Actinomycetota bacterium]